MRHAPITNQERWEENAGYSPSTLAAVIAGLICAAAIVRAHDSTELAEFLEEYADWIEGHLEDWTVTNNGVLMRRSNGITCASVRPSAARLMRTRAAERK